MGDKIQSPVQDVGSPAVLAYVNPAFNPSFVSRIPKPAPLHPPLQELSSTSQMQPAQPHHDMHALHAAHAQSSDLLTAKPNLSPMHLSSGEQQRVHQQQWQQLASARVFSQPGHQVTAVVCSDDDDIGQSSSDPRADVDAEQQLELLLEDAETNADFGVICQRLVAFIEVRAA